MRRGPVAELCLGLLLASGCAHHAEPRWLVDAFPGAYPEVVYYVPTSTCAVGLSIDDGVDPKVTPLILDSLARHAVQATFFLVSDSVEGNESLVRRILDEGHEIGHHMTTDEVTVKLATPELEAKFNQAADVLGGFQQIRWFRAGSGRFDDRVLALTRGRGYRIAMASVAPVDIVLSDPNRMAGFVAAMVRPGSIFVLHDVGERGMRTVHTLDRLLPELQRRGYRVLHLSALDALADKRTAARDSIACL